MSSTDLRKELSTSNEFIARHIGPSEQGRQQMLNTLKLSSVAQLISQTVPDNIRLPEPMNLASPKSEQQMLQELKAIANKNKVNNSFIGQGYYDTFVPNVILRNVLENPGWYTAYTPYQPEIAQGRLEALLNYQQMIIDLTGMELANASLLDEATAAAEAMSFCRRAGRSKSNLFFVADDVHPQTLNVLQTRAHYFHFELVVAPVAQLNEHEVFGALLQYPGSSGKVQDLSEIIAAAQKTKAVVAVASDLLALTLLKSPGEMGADIAIGSAQRFGVPMGYGGPHAAFMATSNKQKRNIPGRIIGVSKDTRDQPALRMAMQTREQHIRREKANSNICTAQALLANMAAFYAVFHGPQGLKKIARRVHHFASVFAEGIKQSGFALAHGQFFDTVTVETGRETGRIYQAALDKDMNLRLHAKQLGVSFDETHTESDVEQLWQAFGVQLNFSDVVLPHELQAIPDSCIRTSEYLTHPVFNSHHSETQMLRYLKSLENKDFSLTHGMIPLGSCTMKLNATAQMLPVTWPEFGQIHPFAPEDQCVGYDELAVSLNSMLKVVTGYDDFSLQPNSGAQGEYAGLIAIQRYHESRGEGHRNICLIPTSAHGTNPASAAMVSMNVVLVECDVEGNVDLEDLDEKVAAHANNLSCIMITYPSTHGVYEAGIRHICDKVHSVGGQVYLDGANMNAQVGITSPGFIGSDVSHLNLHKTFCIPHGGGGPGMGPIGVKSHLAPFLPGSFESNTRGAVSATAMGSASILPISWAYIALMGAEGLTEATEVAILNANYIMERLAPHYPVLFRGNEGRVAHECIIDLRPLKESSGISEEDVAKRLMDYGFHAPTMSFPVAGTLMIEPTESESKEELDRFIDAMIAIRGEIAKVEAGTWSLENNPLVNAPHTMADLSSDEWERPYTRQRACFPTEHTRVNKFWPTTNRVDNVYGDRNLICSCPSIESYR
ncbi:glycine dehydrogenase (aminomethyl-transferring) [Parashewanella spongiae]|uniref:Glycine dehydrogenase (decarboxylating) n=1 Tax=Parashewanella spongiae TaxID=342950 RepID=A0A3A6TVE8_9GAMM|nr:aminomethyl-transferring glycine dehydrogenase [Parashewanella spongiae]MCL1078636.1 aminomethyl-transferring glycine dehydrogenase [Parashewanella spongiae]RJY12971.1 glycine dehydrogenase (aminomethyl-transferring) [Parashewanella spongiae]